MDPRNPLAYVLLSLCLVPLAHGHNHGSTAYAVPLDGIKIDGNLDDWPEGMVRYRILTNAEPYGDTDLKDADLTKSPDLNAWFMVGYSVGEQLLYVAVRVQDDVLIDGGRNPWSNDACEVYVDGDNSGGLADEMRVSASKLPALQYVAIPGKGHYGIGKSNPSMYGADISLTRTKYAHSRNGDVTVHEWAVQSYDQHPDRPTKIEVGKRLGFDVVVVDKDTKRDASAWVCWAAFGSVKFCNANLLGDLVLIESPAELGTVAGVARKDKAEPFPSLLIDAWQGEMPAGSARTDSGGRFELKLPAGQYTVRPRSGQGVPVAGKAVTVTAGQQTDVEFLLSSAPLPEALRQSIAAYRSLRAYEATLSLDAQVRKPGFEARLTIPITFTCQKPNLIRLEGKGAPLEGAVISDGKLLTASSAQWRRYRQEPAPPRLLASSLRALTAGLHGYAGATLPLARFDGRLTASFPFDGLLDCLLVPKLLLSPDPQKELTAGTESIEVVGKEPMGDHETTVVRISRSAIIAMEHSLSSRWGLSGTVETRLWIDDGSHFIRRASTTYDLEKIVTTGQPYMRKQVKGTVVTLTERHEELRRDPDLAADTFSFSPPKYSTKVENFRRHPRMVREPSEFTGEAAPDFAEKDLRDKEVKLSGLRGKVVLLAFWVARHPNSVEELIVFNNLYRRYKDKGVAVLAFSLDRTDDVVKAFVRENKIELPVLMAGKDLKSAYGGIAFAPLTFVIDKKGLVRHVHIRPPFDDRLLYQRQIELLLKE